MAETVAYTIIEPDGSTKSRCLSFTLVDSPVGITSAMAIGETVKGGTEADGTGSIDLVPGTFTFTIDGEPNTSRITIADGGGPYRLEDLI